MNEGTALTLLIIGFAFGRISWLLVAELKDTWRHRQYKKAMMKE